MVFREKARHLPLYIPEGSAPYFPDPRRERGFDGLIAVGGDLSPQRLLHAYACGIFPWYAEGTDILWWSPNPRALIEMDQVHCSRSLERRLKRGDFQFTFDHAFVEVMMGCADRDEGTWILPEMADAYLKLFELGHAHSVEAWHEGALVGGLYGVQVGGLFAAESMFHRATDASKAVLVVAVNSLARAGIRLFDVQFKTSHLASMGATEIPRDVYLARLAQAVPCSAKLANLELVTSRLTD
ncbi:MAG TPA: leucyl/phenylalanyl-tRNA--protein transferase [Polyangiaceae bacterium]